jgi:hypothetical protein
VIAIYSKRTIIVDYPKNIAPLATLSSPQQISSKYPSEVLQVFASTPRLLAKRNPHRALPKTPPCSSPLKKGGDAFIGILPFIKLRHREESGFPNQGSMIFDVAISISYLGCTKGRLHRRNKSQTYFHIETPRKDGLFYTNAIPPNHPRHPEYYD